MLEVAILGELCSREFGPVIVATEFLRPLHAVIWWPLRFRGFSYGVRGLEFSELGDAPEWFMWSDGLVRCFVDGRCVVLRVVDLSGCVVCSPSDVFCDL